MRRQTFLDFSRALVLGWQTGRWVEEHLGVRVEVGHEALHDAKAERGHRLLQGVLHLESDLLLGLEGRVYVHGREHTSDLAKTANDV